MTKQELQERLDKAIEALKKIEGTLAKHEAKLAKLEAMLTSYPAKTKEEYWEMNEEEQVDGNIKILYDIQYCKEDIKSTTRKIEAKKETIKKYQTALAKAEDNEIQMNGLPDTLKELARVLEEEWTEHDLRIQRDLKSGKMQGTYATRERYLYKTEAEFRKANKEASEMYVLDLVARTEKKIGEIIDWTNVYLDADGYSLNGKVIGTKGIAVLETIVAGGYNIQRLHLRTLVK